MEELGWLNDCNVETLKSRLEKLGIIIDDTIFQLAETLAPTEPYHNFKHELQVAHTVIDLWKKNTMSKEDLILLVIAALFHDAGYKKEKKKLSEEKACNLFNNKFSQKLHLQLLRELIPGRNPQGVTECIRNLILHTKLADHKDPSLDKRNKMLLDADLGCLGYGPEYLLYTVMNLIDEHEGVTRENFVKDEEYFFNKILNRNIFISTAGKQFFQDPFASIEQIEKWGQKVINRAYSVRDNNLSFSQFKEKLQKVINGGNQVHKAAS